MLLIPLCPPLFHRYISPTNYNLRRMGGRVVLSLLCASSLTLCYGDELKKSLNRKNRGLIREKVGLNKCKMIRCFDQRAPPGIERLGCMG